MEVMTLVKTHTDSIKQMIKIEKSTTYKYFFKQNDFGLCLIDFIKAIIILLVITLRKFDYNLLI